MIIVASRKSKKACKRVHAGEGEAAVRAFGKFSPAAARGIPSAFWYLKIRPCSALHAGVRACTHRRHVCTRKCVVRVWVCVREDTFEARMVTVFDHPSSRNDCNPSIRPPKPIYQTQVESSRSSLAGLLHCLFIPRLLFPR